LPHPESDEVCSVFTTFSTIFMIHFLLEIDFTPVAMNDPNTFVDEVLQYALPSIVTFCTAAIGFKLLIYFMNAGKGQ
jgi:ABC-type antimicrobial peptide transport system permease subunit